MANNLGNFDESLSKANTLQNPLSHDQQERDISWYPQACPSSLPRPDIKMREKPYPTVFPSGCLEPPQSGAQSQHHAYPYHADTQTSHTPAFLHQEKSPYQYHPHAATPAFHSKMYPNPYQCPSQLFQPSAGDPVQEYVIGSQQLQRSHHTPVPSTHTPVHQVGCDAESHGSSEVQFVSATMRTESRTKLQGFGSDSRVPEVLHYSKEKVIITGTRSNQESTQAPSDPSKKLSAKTRPTYGLGIKIAPRPSEFQLTPSVEQAKSSHKKKARRTSKSDRPASRLNEMDLCPESVQVETGEQKKWSKQGFCHNLADLRLCACAKTVEGCERGPTSALKKLPTKNSDVRAGSAPSYPEAVDTAVKDICASTCSNEDQVRSDIPSSPRNVENTAPSKATGKNPSTRKGEPTELKSMHSPRGDSSGENTDLESKVCFIDTTTISRSPHSDGDTTEIMRNRQGEKRKRQNVCTDLSVKNAPSETMGIQKRGKHMKHVAPPRLSKYRCRNSLNTNPAFPKETRLTEILESIPTMFAIPPRTPLPLPIPPIPEQPEKDETDDEHDQYELSRRFGKVVNGYVWHSRTGWVMHPSYFQRADFKLCLMHKRCKHKVDCHTTRFRMAILSCAKSKLTTRETEFLWGTSRSGVGRRVGKLKGIPVRYLLLPIKKQ